MKPKPGDISIVDNAGTFLMWYDKDEYSRLTLFRLWCICPSLQGPQQFRARLLSATGDHLGSFTRRNSQWQVLDFSPRSSPFSLPATVHT